MLFFVTDGYPLRHLKSDTDYEIQASVKNVAGFSEYSNSSIFRTSTSGSVGTVHLPSFLFVIFIIPLTIFNFNSNIW